MIPRIRTIARYTVLEAWRTRLPAAAALALLAVLGASLFARELALVQEARMQTIVYAALARLAVVFIVSLHVASALAREFNDKGLDTVLALDVPRWQYIAGKYAGYAAVGATTAALASLPLLPLADAHALAAWFASLALETCIIAAVAMFCVVTFSHLPSAMAFVAGFYVLCRSITALRAIAEQPLAGASTLVHDSVAGTIAALSWLVPPLDAWTRTAWLVGAIPGWQELAFIAAGALAYGTLLLAATLIDFYRKGL